MPARAALRFERISPRMVGADAGIGHPKGPDPFRELSRFRLANQRIGFLWFAACADSQGVWHGGKVSGCGER